MKMIENYRLLVFSRHSEKKQRMDYVSVNVHFI